MHIGYNQSYNTKNKQANYSMSVPLSLEARVEALLFVADEPVSAARLARSLGASASAVEKALESLQENLQSRGIRLVRHRGLWHLATAPECGEDVARFLGLAGETRLSPAALETLAIIAYRQPITRPQIDAVRGVSSDGVIRSLLAKGLIEEVGRADTPGRPILYATTDLFLRSFGLVSLSDLPPLTDHQNT